jgi:hypothetical protein
MPNTTLIVRHLLIWKHPLVVGFRPEMHRLVQALRTHTDPSARILFEDQLRLLEQTDPESTHWTPLLPFLLGPDRRQFIGGLYQTAFIDHSRLASFGDFHLGDRFIDEWTPEELERYFRQYNIGWVVCWSALARYSFDRLPSARRVAVLPRYSTLGRLFLPEAHTWDVLNARLGRAGALSYIRQNESVYALYRIERTPSFFLRGAGRLASVELNRVELADVVPEDGEIVLSLHWLDTWRTDPPLPLAPVPVPGDPVPFVRIRLEKELGRIVLFNSYGR